MQLMYTAIIKIFAIFILLAVCSIWNYGYINQTETTDVSKMIVTGIHDDNKSNDLMLENTPTYFNRSQDFKANKKYDTTSKSDDRHFIFNQTNPKILEIIKSNLNMQRYPQNKTHNRSAKTDSDEMANSLEIDLNNIDDGKLYIFSKNNNEGLKKDLIQENKICLKYFNDTIKEYPKHLYEKIEICCDNTEKKELLHTEFERGKEASECGEKLIEIEIKALNNTEWLTELWSNFND